MIKNEFEIEQIELTSNFLGIILLPKNCKLNDLNNLVFENDFLKLKQNLCNLIKQHNFIYAENVLKSQIENNKNSSEILQISLWFYLKLNDIEDEILNKNNFSKHKILNGLKNLEKIVLNYEFN